MKIASVRIKNFKRFSSLDISNIPDTTKLVLLAGPNGSGKSSLFDAFIEFYRSRSGYGHGNDEKYCRKDFTQPFSWGSPIGIDFHQGFQVTKNSFYFRSAYRNEADFNMTQFGKQPIPYEVLRIQKTTQNDQSVSENYSRLVHATMEGVYNEANNDKSVRELREELIGQIRKSMINVFGDLYLNSISDPLSDGSFYFRKGSIDSFHFKNLSGGEKAAFDIMLDILIKKRHYNNTIFCIDEPELHIHTRLQSALVKELVDIIPENSQIWLSTHSLGVLRSAKEMEANIPGSVAVLDFDGANFDEHVSMHPSRIDRLMWEKFLSISLDDLAPQVVPKFVVVCEGSKLGKRRKDYDAEIYSRIFSPKYQEIVFVSGGGSNDLSKNEIVSGVLSGLLKGSKVFSLIDKDDRSPSEVNELEKRNIFVLSRRNLESYLFDNEIIYKLASSHGKIDKVPELLQAISDSLSASVKRGNADDDFKSASGEAYLAIKRILGLTNCGSNVDSFMRDTLTPLISSDTVIFQELEKDIIGKITVAYQPL